MVVLTRYSFFVLILLNRIYKMATIIFNWTSEYRKNRKIVLKRDKYKCRYCGKKAFVADHIVPRTKRMRDDSIENLVASCHRCNIQGSNIKFDNFEQKKTYILGKLVFLDSKNCVNCNKLFFPTRWWNVYCSPKCCSRFNQMIYWKKQIDTVNSI